MNYKDRSDYLNREHRRNEYNTDIYDYNCGGYALKTFSWYKPYDFNMFDQIDEWTNNNVDDDEIVARIEDICITNLRKDFSDLRLIDVSHQSRGAQYEEKLLKKIKDDEEIIAFRIAYSFFDYDFHFRVYRNNKWSEKCGNSGLTSCEFTEDDWGEGTVYNRTIYYFARKVA